MSGVMFHVHCVGLGCHVLIGVGRLVVRFHHAYAIPSFLHDVVVRLYLITVNADCNEVLSLYPPSVTIDTVNKGFPRSSPKLLLASSLTL